MRKTRKKTVANDPGREVDSLRSRYPVWPLEYLMKVLNNDKLPTQLHHSAAKAALSYMHPKLKPIASDELGAAEEHAPEQHDLDLSRLTEEEFERLAQLLEKAK